VLQAYFDDLLRCAIGDAPASRYFKGFRNLCAMTMRYGFSIKLKMTSKYFNLRRITIAQPGSAPAFWEHDYRGLLSTLFATQKKEKILIHFSP